MPTMKHFSTAPTALLFVLLIITTILYTSSLYRMWCMLTSEYNTELKNARHVNVHEFMWASSQVAVEFTDNFPSIKSESDWAFVPPKIFHLGPQSATDYVISMHQQLHCLDRIRVAYLSYQDKEWPKPTTLFYEEAEGCMEQLRQIMLCNADLTLEPTEPVVGPNGKAIPSATGMGVLHQCANWHELEWKLDEMVSNGR